MTSETCSTAHPELRADDQLCFKLHSLSLRFVGRWDRFLRSRGLTFAEYIVLLAVLERWPVGEMSLGERLEFDVRTLDDALVGLERQRLVTRSADHGMIGQRVVEPTQEGIGKQADLMVLRGHFNCELGLTPAESKAVLKQIDRLAEAVSLMEIEEAERAVKRAELTLQAR